MSESPSLEGSTNSCFPETIMEETLVCWADLDDLFWNSSWTLAVLGLPTSLHQGTPGSRDVPVLTGEGRRAHGLAGKLGEQLLLRGVLRAGFLFDHSLVHTGSSYCRGKAGLKGERDCHRGTLWKRGGHGI